VTFYFYLLVAWHAGQPRKVLILRVLYLVLLVRG